MAVLLYQVLVTRILSVTLSYHFAFLTISLSMLGLCAPGVIFSLFAPSQRTLSRSLWAASLLVPGSVLCIVHWGAPLRGYPSLWVLFLLAPLLALGSGVCILLLMARGKGISRMYAADLLGAALGALLSVPLLTGLATPTVVASLGILPLLALSVLETRRLWVGLAAGLLVSSVVWGAPFRLRYTRYYVEQEAPLYEKWTPTARITVLSRIPNGVFPGWGLGSKWSGPDWEYLWIDQDGSAGTPIFRFDPNQPPSEKLLYDVTAAPYELGLGPRACIVGGGGGKDILTARLAGAREIEVVELNPFTVRAVSEEFRGFSGDPYHLPGVSAFVGEGRSHFSRSRSRCDVLQISQIDTFAASAAGAYALSENSLYTVEALREFWSRLSENGVLSISRWVRGPAWPEAARLSLLAQEALSQEGIGDPRQHMLALIAQGTGNLMLFRKPVSSELLVKADQIAKRRGFSRVFPPLLPPALSSPLALVLLEGPGRFEAEGYDLSPPTDDRPFFFQTLSLVHGTPKIAKQGTGEREQSVFLLRGLTLVLSTLTLLLVVLPLVAKGRLPRQAGWVKRTGFFATLGIAFLLVEIPLIQRLTIYLGHPSYSTTVVLGSLLLGAGIGAGISGRIPERHVRASALLVPLLVAILCFGFLWLVVPATQASGFWVRVALTFATVFTLGLPMGLLLPLGMRFSDGADRSFYWAINGATSVLSGTLALVLSLLFGFSAVLGIAVWLYATAAFLLPSEGSTA